MRNFYAVFESALWPKSLTVLVLAAFFLVISIAEFAFGQSSSNDTHLYFFTSQGCAPCEMVKPALAELDSAGYPVTTVDIRQRPDWADHFGVDRTPTVIMVRDRKIIGRHAGVIGYRDLLQWFSSAGYVPQPNANRIGPDQNNGNSTDSSAFNSTGTKVVINETRPSNLDTPQSSSTQPNAARRSLPQPNSKATLDSPKSPTTFTSSTMHHGTSTPANSFEQTALAATVKIKVEDETGISYATGTVIHTHENESLVVTCGHVFRDSQGAGEISGEYGFSSQSTSVAQGELIFYDADARDIALLVLKTNGDSLPTVKVASKRATIEKGTDAFSIGCDHGQPPTIRHTRIKNRASYDGAIKYDIYGRPVDGRSGGGLFTDDGQLIGVCNAAVVDVDEGIYTALDTIHWQLAHAHLDHLFQPDFNSPASNSFASDASESDSSDFGSPPRPAHSDIAQASPAAAPAQSADWRTAPSGRPTPQFPRSVDRPQGNSSLVSLRSDAPSNANSIDGNSEVLIIVRSKDDSGMAKTITLPNPSHRLIDYLQNMPPVKSTVRQIDAAKYHQPKTTNAEFRRRVQRGMLR